MRKQSESSGNFADLSANWFTMAAYYDNENDCLDWEQVTKVTDSGIGCDGGHFAQVEYTCWSDGLAETIVKIPDFTICVYREVPCGRILQNPTHR